MLHDQKENNNGLSSKVLDAQIAVPSNFSTDTLCVDIHNEGQVTENPEFIRQILDAKIEFKGYSNDISNSIPAIATHIRRLNYKSGDSVFIRATPKHTATIENETINLVTGKPAYILTFELVVEFLSETQIKGHIWTLKNSKRKAGSKNSAWWNRLNNINKEGYNIYLAPNGGLRNADIERSHFILGDKDTHPNFEENFKIFEEFLPPSLVIFTGNKSPHVYWEIDGGVNHQQFKDLSQRLISKLELDDTVCKPCQLFRLAGFCNSKFNVETRELTLTPVEIKQTSEAKYTIEEFSKALPPKPDTSKNRHRLSVAAQVIEEAKEKSLEHSYSFEQIDADKIPAKGLSRDGWRLETLLPRDINSLIETGVEDGEGRGKNAYKVAITCISREEYAKQKHDIVFVKNSREYFEDFCNRCSPKLEQHRREQIFQSALNNSSIDKESRYFIDCLVKACRINWHKYGQFQASNIPIDNSFTPTNVIHQPYLTPENFQEWTKGDEKVITLVKSLTGSGKTTALKGLRDDCFESNNLFAIVTVLNSICKQAAKNLGLTFRTEVDSSKCLGITLCIDSIETLWSKNLKRENSTIVFDEAHTLAHLISTNERLEKKIKAEDFGSEKVSLRMLIKSRLEALNKEAKNIICLDANLNDTSVDFWKRQFPDRKVVVIENTYRRTGERIVLHCSKNKWNPETMQLEGKTIDKDSTNKLLEDTARKCFESKGEQILVFNTDSKDRTKDLAKFLEDSVPGIRVLVINSETRSDEIVQAWLSCPDLISKNYDVILASPTAGIGVSLDEKDRYIAIIELVGAVNADTAIQFIRRVRYPIQDRIVIAPPDAHSNKFSTSLTVKGVLQDISKKGEFCAEIVRSMFPNSQHRIFEELDFACDENGIIHNEVMHDYAIFLAEDNRQRINYFDSIRQKLEAEGIEVFIECVEDKDDSIKERYKSAKDGVLEQETKQWLNRKPLRLDNGDLDIERAKKILGDDDAKHERKKEAEKTIFVGKYPGVILTENEVKEHLIKKQKSDSFESRVKLGLLVKYPHLAKRKEYNSVIGLDSYNREKQVQYKGKSLYSLVNLIRESGIYDLIQNNTEINAMSPELAKISEYFNDNPRECEKSGVKKVNVKDIKTLNEIVSKFTLPFVFSRKEKDKCGKETKYYKPAVKDESNPHLYWRMLESLEAKADIYPSSIYPGRESYKPKWNLQKPDWRSELSGEVEAKWVLENIDESKDKWRSVIDELDKFFTSQHPTKEGFKIWVESYYPHLTSSEVIWRMMLDPESDYYEPYQELPEKIERLSNPTSKRITLKEILRDIPDNQESIVELKSKNRSATLKEDTSEYIKERYLKGLNNNGNDDKDEI